MAGGYGGYTGGYGGYAAGGGYGGGVGGAARGTPVTPPSPQSGSRRYSVPLPLATQSGSEQEEVSNKPYQYQPRGEGSRRAKSAALTEDCRKVIRALEEKGNGSMLRGWRRELDPEGSLEVGFEDFCKSMATLGVQVDTDRLFNLDGSPDRVTLEDLAPDKAALINRFREWVKATFEGPIGMWEALVGASDGQMDKQAFAKGCKERRFKTNDNDLDILYACLDYDESGSVTQDEVMFLEADPLIREQELFKMKMKSRSQRQRLLAYIYRDDGQRAPSTKHRRAQRPWMAETFEKLPAIVCEKRLDRQQVFYRERIEARVAFVEFVRSKFGNEVRAWRRSLDPDCNFQVGKTALRQYCRAHALDINFSALWSALDRDCDDYFTLEEIGVRPASVLAMFRTWARKEFGSVAAIWDLEEVDEERCKPQKNGSWRSNKKMMLASFARCLKKLGWEGEPGASAVLCHGLDLYGCGFISLPDLWWLDAWDPPDWLAHGPDPAALVEFMALVQSEYDTALMAWRHLLDADNDNIVSWSEFLSACSKVKFRGNAGGAWRCLDKDCSGTISLREWDPKGAELLLSFKTWAEDSYGSIELAFKAFDRDGNGHLSFAELRRATRRLKWQGDVKTLFNCVGIKNQNRSMALSDISFLDTWIDEDIFTAGTLTPSGSSVGHGSKATGEPGGQNDEVTRVSTHKTPEEQPADEDKKKKADPTMLARHDSMAAFTVKKSESVRTKMAEFEDTLEGDATSWGPESETKEPAKPRTRHEELHRKYHVIDSSSHNKPKLFHATALSPTKIKLKPAKGTKVPGTKVPVKSKSLSSLSSLSWLDRINQIDGYSTVASN